MLYSLLGSKAAGSDAMLETEQRLREALLQACLRDPTAGGFLSHAADPTPVAELPADALMARRAELDDVLRTFFCRLRALAAARVGLAGSERLLLSTAETVGDVYRPLLRTVIERTLRMEAVPEVVPLSTSIGVMSAVVWRSE